MGSLASWINKDTAGFFAILLSPLIAWYVQYWKSKRDEKISRKSEIFRDLMITRGYGQTQALSLQHVNALNRIDIEFYKDKEVLDAWDIYREHLLHPNLPLAQNMSEEQNKIIQILWDNERIKHLVNLLYAIACALGYKKLSKVTLEKKMYVPQAYDSLETAQNQLRNECINLLKGKPLKVEITNINSNQNDKSEN
jgi:hypothetical protein